MHVSEGYSYDAFDEENLLDLINEDDHRTMRKLKRNCSMIYVRVRFRHKLQRYHGGMSLAPIILSSFEESLLLDEVECYITHYDVPFLKIFNIDRLINLLHDKAGIPMHHVGAMVRRFEGKAHNFATARYREANRNLIIDDNYFNAKGRLYMMMIPIVMEVVFVTEERYNQFEKIPRPATESSILALEEIKVNNNVGSSSSSPNSNLMMEKCAICLENFSASATADDAAADIQDNDLQRQDVVVVTRMPCSHLFHKDCILHWLSQSYLCPTCRFELPYDLSDETCLY